MWRALFPLLLCQCVEGLSSSGVGSSPESSHPASDGLIAGAAAAGLAAKELATPPAPTTVLGWHLEIAGGRARFYACEDETTCGMHPIELPANEIRAMTVVGRTRPQRTDRAPDDEEKDVLRLTLRHPIARTSRAGEVYDENHGFIFGGKGQ